MSSPWLYATVAVGGFLVSALLHHLSKHVELLLRWTNQCITSIKLAHDESSGTIEPPDIFVHMDLEAAIPLMPRPTPWQWTTVTAQCLRDRLKRQFIILGRTVAAKGRFWRIVKPPKSYRYSTGILRIQELDGQLAIDPNEVHAGWIVATDGEDALQRFGRQFSIDTTYGSLIGQVGRSRRTRDNLSVYSDKHTLIWARPLKTRTQRRKRIPNIPVGMEAPLTAARKLSEVARLAEGSTISWMVLEACYTHHLSISTWIMHADTGLPEQDGSDNHDNLSLGPRPLMAHITQRARLAQLAHEVRCDDLIGVGSLLQ